MNRCYQIIGRSRVLLTTLLGLQLLIWGTDTGAAAYGPAVVTVQSEVEISRGEIFLEDIAEIYSKDPNTRRALERLPIAKAPNPGRTRRISPLLIQNRIKQFRLNHPRSTFKYPSRVVVKRPGVTIDAEKLQPWIAEFVAANKPPQVNSFQIKKVHLGQAVILPRGNISHQISFARDTGGMGVLPLSVSFYINGKYYSKATVLVEMEAWADVVVLRNHVRRSRLIRSEDIDRVNMEVSQLPHDVVHDPTMVIGKRVKKSLVPDTVLRESLVITPDVIKRGDVVNIVIETNGFKITTLGQAKRHGRRGERIRVVNLDSKRTIYARVVDERTVKVEF